MSHFSVPGSETLFESRWLGLYRTGTWDFAARPNSRACVGVLPLTDDGKVVLIGQYRHPVQGRVIEIPAGLVGDEDEHRDEPLADTAARELLEETGYRCAKIRELGASPTSAGMTPEFIHLFVATGLTLEAAGGGVGDEDITVFHVPLDGLRDWLREREGEGYSVDHKIFAALWLAGV